MADLTNELLEGMRLLAEDLENGSITIEVRYQEPITHPTSNSLLGLEPSWYNDAMENYVESIKNHGDVGK